MRRVTNSWRPRTRPGSVGRRSPSSRPEPAELLVGALHGGVTIGVIGDATWPTLVCPLHRRPRTSPSSSRLWFHGDHEVRHSVRRAARILPRRRRRRSAPGSSGVQSLADSTLERCRGGSTRPSCVSNKPPMIFDGLAAASHGGLPADSAIRLPTTCSLRFSPGRGRGGTGPDRICIVAAFCA